MSVMRSNGLLGVSIQTMRRGFRQRRGDRRRIAEVDELHRELATLLPGGEQAERAAITVVRHDDARAHRQQMCPTSVIAPMPEPVMTAPAPAFEIRERVARAESRVGLPERL